VRIAALDLGSNSFHMIVVEACPDGSFIPLVREREMLRLGDLVARDRVIGHRAADEAIVVIARFRSIAEANGADEIIAVGTSAIREALDGNLLVDRVRVETGVKITVVDGTREAELIFRAIRSSVVIDPGPALAADLGGGSLELAVGDRAELAFATSVHLGVGRLTTELVANDPPSDKDLKRLRARIAGTIEPVLGEILALRPRQLIGSSGTFVALARMAAAGGGGIVHEAVNQLTVGRAELEALRDRLYSLPAAQRGKLPGAEPRRADLLPAGMAVLEYLMDATGLVELTVSDWALREGIVLDAIAVRDRVELLGDSQALRRWSVLALGRRSNWSQPHSRQVAALALQLFDATAGLHQLGPAERDLLEFGALLHDIGGHISRQNHDRHSAYLIENGGLRGFSPQEVRILATMGRYHVAGTPKATFKPFAQLAKRDRSRAVALTSILRIAEGLDSSHRGLVQAIRAEPPGDGDRLSLLLAARAEPELELWTVRRKQALLERTFGVECVFRAEVTGRTGPDAGPLGAGLG
jgi:exopolyphosphatase/guanosine-5'-triphosphate,3'-diphosphate pyrophosphatase